jgi:hypothetical protein
MIFLYIAETVAPSGKLVRKYTMDPDRAADLPGRLTARSINNKIRGMHNGRNTQIGVY